MPHKSEPTCGFGFQSLPDYVFFLFIIIYHLNVFAYYIELYQKTMKINYDFSVGKLCSHLHYETLDK